MFTLDKLGRIVIDPNLLLIPEFNKIYNADKTATKDKAYERLAGVFFYCDFKSPYNNYPEIEKIQKIVEDQKLEKDFFKNKEIQAAIEKYNELNTTPSMKYFKAMVKAMETLCDRMEDPEAKTKDLNDSISKVKDNVKAYNDIKEQVEKEIAGLSKMRGERKLGNRENPTR